MPGPFVGNLFLSCENRGWTETYYPVAADHESAMTDMQGICTARQAMSLSDVIVSHIRVSDLTVRGDAFNKAPVTPNGTYTEDGASTIDPNIAILFESVSDDFLHHSHMYIRGIPFSVFTTHPLTYLAGTAPVAWRAARTAYIAAVLAAVHMVQRHAGPTYTTSPMASFTDVRATIRKAGRPFGLQPGRRVHV